MPTYDASTLRILQQVRERRSHDSVGYAAAEVGGVSPGGSQSSRVSRALAAHLRASARAASPPTGAWPSGRGAEVGDSWRSSPRTGPVAAWPSAAAAPGGLAAPDQAALGRTWPREAADDPGASASPAASLASVLAASATGQIEALAALARRFGWRYVTGCTEAETRRTPLHLAARYGHVVVCELLLKRHAEPSAEDLQGTTPLALACLASQAFTAQLLVHGKADPQHLDLRGRNAFHIACASAAWSLPAMLLESHPSIIRAVDQEGHNALYYALANKNRFQQLQILEFLLVQRCNANLRDTFGRTPLWYAAEDTQFGGDAVDLLLKFGAVPDLAPDQEAPAERAAGAPGPPVAPMVAPPEPTSPAPMVAPPEPGPKGGAARAAERQEPPGSAPAPMVAPTEPEPAQGAGRAAPPEAAADAPKGGPAGLLALPEARPAEAEDARCPENTPRLSEGTRDDFVLVEVPKVRRPGQALAEKFREIVAREPYLFPVGAKHPHPLHYWVHECNKARLKHRGLRMWSLGSEQTLRQACPDSDVPEPWMSRVAVL